jgi:hypothetical protein
LLKGSFVNFLADMGASHHVGIHESDDKSGYTSIDLPASGPETRKIATLPLAPPGT